MNLFNRILKSINRYGFKNFLKVNYLNFCRKNQFFLNLQFLNLKSLNILLFIPNFVSPVFSINKNKILRTTLAFKGFNPKIDPFVKLIQEINIKNVYKYEGSNLEIYYKKNVPIKIYDLYPLTKNVKNSKIFSLNARYISHILPWDENFYKKTIKEIVDEVDQQKNILRKCKEYNIKFDKNIFYGNQNFGPVHKEMGKIEFERYKHVLNSINNLGYKPDYKNNPHISGQFLKKENNWLLFISDGVHRAAVLTALENIKIPIAIKVLPKVINRESVKTWAGVARGYYTVDEALVIFDSIFESKNFLNYNE